MSQRILPLIPLFSLIGLLLAGCSDKKTSDHDQNQTNLPIDIENVDPGKGFRLMASNCFSCHNPDPTMTNQVAPSIAEIKIAYTANDESHIQFTKNLLAFLNDPTPENIRMPDAVKKYGPMPKMNYPREDLIHIAGYLYHTPLEEEDWYRDSFENEKTKYRQDPTQLSYLEKGQELAMATKSVLGKNLLEAIKEHGTENALSFCNIKAIPLTDSMSAELNASIKRVSDQPRNPNNQANAHEMEYIRKAKSLLAEGREVPGIVHPQNGQMVGYYPIITNKLCLKCHGQPITDIQPATLNRLDSLYPNDQARGYGPDKLRGIWIVEMSTE